MRIDWVDKSRALNILIRNVVDGRFTPPSGKPLEKFAPRDGRVLYRFGAGDIKDVEEAVNSARHAFEDRRWSGLPLQRRKEILHTLAVKIEQHSEELALVESLDVGKPIGEAVNIDIPLAAAIMRFNAEALDKCLGPVYAVDHSSLTYQLRRPFGVVAGIVGWNFPLVLAVGKIAPALAAGNCVVLKPSELTPFSAMRLAELALETGVPDGVLNVVNGDCEIGAALARHCDIDLLSFTGSTQTGKKLLVAAGKSNMKRLVLECGGKAPNIVFDDSPNLEAVADAIVARAFWNQGQVCTASSRLLIQESIQDALLPILIERVATLRPGDPLDPATKFGAVVSRGHQQKVRRYIESGQQEGASVAYEAAVVPPPVDGGFYVSPVVFEKVSPGQTIAREEIFGPVLTVLSFRDEAEAIRIANDTIYGLSAILWTKDLGRAHRITHSLEAGWVVVNATDRPFGGPPPGVISIGGFKQSGIGTEGGIEGLQEYMTKTVVQYHV